MLRTAARSMSARCLVTPRPWLHRGPVARPYSSLTSGAHQPSPVTIRFMSSLPPPSAKTLETNPEAPTKTDKKSALSALTLPTEKASSFRKILQLAKDERSDLIKGVGYLLFSSTVTMSIPLTIGTLIDVFSNKTLLPFGLELWQASVLLFALFSAGAAANAARAVLFKVSGQRIIARLRERTFASALQQEVEYVEKGEGDIISRLSVDTSIVGESVTQNLSDGLRATVMSLVGLGAMFYLSPTLTTLMLVVVPPVSLGAVYYGKYVKTLSHKTQEAMGDMTKVASESLAALRTVQAFNAAPQEQAKFGDKTNTVLALAKKEAMVTGLFYGGTGWSGNITLLALLGYGGSLVSSGMITVGDLTSLLIYSVYVGGGLQMLSGFFAAIMRGIGAGGRIFSLLDRKPEIAPNVGVPLASSRRERIRFEGIEFEYPTRKGVNVLKAFNLDVGVGESVAIVGKSGSGKSSVQSLLLRYYDPSAGRVTYGGQDIREFTVDSWRNVIGIVPQDPVLLSGSIADNIAYGNPAATREQIEAAAREANCEFVWGMPQGFDTEIRRLSLSGGQKQRLAIARALLKKPAILALDEATAALDAASETRVNDAVDKILRARQTTVLFVAHRISTIARAERVVVLEGGRITESGTYRELVNRPESRFRVLMAAQLTAGQIEPDSNTVEDSVEEVEPETV